MKKALATWCGALCLSLNLAPSSTLAANWQPLFNGKDLSGWQQLGGTASYEIKDKAIIGTAVADSPNSFLATEKNYGDFIFETWIKTSSGLNSGIQFRSKSEPDYLNGRVYGYQMELDPSARRWSGGIYEEAKRGWLVNMVRNEQCQSALKADDWNHYRIEAIGNQVRTWVNKVPCANLLDDGNKQGFIALQVHSIKDADLVGSTVQLKEPKILTDELEAQRWPMPESVVEFNYLPNQLSLWQQQSGWRLLWDGETTQGWHSAGGDSFPDKGWGIENGELIVYASLPGIRTGGDIVSVSQFSNFELELDFMITEGANSGIKYFIDPNLLKTKGRAIGLEFQILDDKRHPDAKKGKYGNRTMGSLYDLIPARNLSELGRDSKRVNSPRKWNRARIVVQGSRVEHWLNNIKVVEFERGDEDFHALVNNSKYAGKENFGEWDKTPILLQDHSDKVHFRSIKIRELK